MKKISQPHDFVPLSVVDNFTNSAEVTESNAIAETIAVEIAAIVRYFCCDH